MNILHKKTKLVRKAVTLMFLAFFYTDAISQIVSGNAFLKSNYVELGIAPGGSFGSSVNAPSGYHPNSIDFGNQLGFVSDPAKDGWSTGSPNFVGDYFLPGTPEEGWGLTIDGTNYNNNRINSVNDISGSIVNYDISSSFVSATWQGSVAGISISAKSFIPQNSLFIVTEVTVTNTSSSTINNIYYMRNVDPDQGASTPGAGSTYETQNTIAHQNPSTTDTVLVSATTASGGHYLGLGAIDSRARVTHGGFANRSAIDIWNGTGLNNSGTVSADEAISIAFNIGNLAPNQSTSLAYAYILGPADLAIALGRTVTVLTECDSFVSPSGKYTWTTSGIYRDTIQNSVGGDSALVFDLTINNATASSIAVTALNAYTSPSGVVKTVSEVFNDTIPNAALCDSVITINLTVKYNPIYADTSTAGAGYGNSWTNPFTSLQDAFDYAMANEVDTVFVGQGTYCPAEAPNGSTNPRNFAFYLNDSNVVVIGSLNPATGLAGDSTVLCAAISGSDTSYHVLVTGGLDTTSRFENLTITGGRAKDSSSYTVKGRTFYSQFGGGVYNNLSSPVYKNVTITGNEAKNGGGMYNYTSAPCIENSTIQNNKANYDGGGLYNIAGASPKVTDVTIQNNSAANNGGGIMNVSSSNPLLTRVNILSNTAGIRGGGMYSRSAGNAIGYDLVFNGNTAGYYGGGMYNYDYASPVITNVVFSNNSAQTGGAVYNFFQSNPVIINATYTNNTGSASGGAMYNSSSMPTVKNSIFIDNSNDITNTSSMLFGSFNASDEGTSSGANVGSGFLSLSGASASDVFVNPSDLDGADDVWMTTDDGLASKLCNNTIDAGSNSNVPNYISTDIAGNERIAGSTTDLGAYEAMYTNGLSLPTAAGTYTSDKTYINGSWIYYCDCSTESVLLALDTTGSGAVVPATGVSLKIGNYPTISWSNDGGLITNTKGGAMIDRRWNVNPTTQPTGTVGVKYFFTDGEYEALVDTLANHNGGADPTTIDDVTELNMYKIANSGTFLDPHSSGITGIILTNDATTASTTKWVYEAYGSDHSATFKVTSFSGGGGGSGGGSAPLPVELINFTATPIANHEAKLDWATASETNNSHFNVERSYDGRNFEAIGRVEGHGNSNEILAYDFVDNTIAASENTVYYRLHQVDYNGEFERTVVRKVDFAAPAVLDNITVYPNPFRNEVFINTQNLEVESYTLSIAATNGQEVYHAEITENLENQKLDLRELSSGVYILTITSENATQHFRIIRE